MVSKLDIIRIHHDLLDYIPQELKKRVKEGNLVDNEVLEISRYVLIEEKENGSFNISKNIPPEVGLIKTDTNSKQVELIRKICLNHIDKSISSKEEKECDIIEKTKTLQKDSVKITRNRKKPDYKVEKEPPLQKTNYTELSAIHQIVNIEDFFDIKKGLPQNLLVLTAEHLDETLTTIVDSIKNKRKLPDYLTENIKELDLSNQNIDLDIFNEITEQFKNLKSLKLPENATDAWFTKLSMELPNITRLDLSRCSNVGDLSSFKGLTYLKLGRRENISDIGSLTALTELHLFGCKDLNNIDSLKTLTSLKKLTVSECSNIRDFNVLKSHTTLTDLCLFSCRGFSDVSFLENLSSLTDLDLSYCSNVSSIDAIKSLKSLTGLCLVSCDIMDITVINSNTSLTKLNLSGNPNIITISTLRDLSSLTYLNLSHCSNVTDITDIIAFDSLTHLDLSGCKNIIDTSILEVLPKTVTLFIP